MSEQPIDYAIIFLLPLPVGKCTLYYLLVIDVLVSRLYIKQTRLCNILHFFTAVKTILFR